ncbi:hypothetical protein OC845_005113 [Tilletia horrida]|nr:hypothetical protein OC845_005113 [Tilletia horrida]
MVNFTCPVKPHLEPDPVPFFSNGNINFKAHDVGWIVCGFFSLISCTASFWLILRHLKYYTCPPQQRHIVRMLFMVPVYSLVSFASYLFYTEALYYQVIRDCYEAVTITSFFFLLLQYVGDTPEEQHFVFKQVKLKKWFFPLGCWRYRPDGLKFLWLMKICILQYAIFRPLCTVLTVGMQYFGVYCLESWMPWFGHFWMSATITVSVSVAMYCVVQFYLPISEELKPYEPVLKFLAVKAVVFLTFWQESFLSMLVVFGAIKDAAHWNTEQIVVGYAAILSCFEMVIFAFLHIRAFSYRPYRPEDHTKTTRRLRAFGHVLDFRDWFWQMKLSSKWAAANRKGEDFTLVDEIRARKYHHLMRALGKERTMDLQDFRDQRREELMAHFWKHPTDPIVDEKRTEHGDSSEKKTVPKAERPEGGLYTVAELQQQAKRESRLAHSRQSSRDGKSKGGKTKPETDELRRLASVLDSQEEAEEQHGDEADVNESLLQSKDRPSKRNKRAQPGYLDPHPELTVYHAPILPPDFELFSPDTEGEKGFAEELEDEYKARGLWGIGNDHSRGEYVLTSLAEGPTSASASGNKGHGKQKSWWRALRERISGSGVEEPKRLDHSDRWQGVQVDSAADYEEPAWLERDNFTLPGPRRSSLAVGGLASPTDSDAVPLESSFVKVSGHRVNSSPTSGLPMYISRKPVPNVSPSLQEARSVISADGAERASQPQPWLFQQHQSPLSKVITSQIQGRDSSLKVQGAAGLATIETSSHQGQSAEGGSLNKRSEQPIFHPARPISTAQSFESGSSGGQNSLSNSGAGGPYRNKSMSASIRLLSEAGTFGPAEQDDVAAAETEIAKAMATKPTRETEGGPTLGALVQADGAERVVNVLERSDSVAVASSKQASVSRCTSSAQRTTASPLVEEDSATFAAPYPNQLSPNHGPSRAEKRRAPHPPDFSTNVASAQRAAIGPKGRPISIVMPGVLSSTHDPYQNFQSSPSEIRSVSASATNSNPSQPSRSSRAEKATRSRISEPVPASSMPRSPDQAASSRPGLAVGNIVSRAAIADAQWAPQLQERRAEERQPSSRHSKPSHSSKHSHIPSGRSQQRDSTHQPRPHRSHRTSSANTMGREGMPLNAVGAIPPSSSSNRRSSNDRMAPQYQRHSDQHVQYPRASFNPYTGEPVWTDGNGRSVSRDWVATHGPIPNPNANASGTIRSSSPPRSELELNGGFGRIEYID